ncbi:hypothetical protein ACHAWF_006410 [Thalassiosira exigua]
MLARKLPGVVLRRRTCAPSSSARSRKAATATVAAWGTPSSSSSTSPFGTSSSSSPSTPFAGGPSPRPTLAVASPPRFVARRRKSTAPVDDVDDVVEDRPPAAIPPVGDGYLGKILNAKVYDVAVETELQHAKNLSQLLSNTVCLKREDTQPVFSFKIRGAYNAMASLSPGALSRGVVACSAGNHAQGVALSARMLGCRAVICMPLATPSIKVNSVRAHGGETVEVRLFGNNYDEAAVEAKRLELEEGLAMIHPFDDELVIAGQGTIGELLIEQVIDEDWSLSQGVPLSRSIEILKKSVGHPVDAIFVCCGGGGMLAGISAYVKQVRPNVKIYGVEAADAAGMTASLAAGKVVTLPSVGLFADGAAVKTVGTETFRVCKKYVDGMITVDTDQICNAIKLAYNDARVVLEPAGALAVAGLKKYVEENNISGQTLVAITSGANMDFNRLRVVSERSDDSERSLEITIQETPGAFRAMYSKIWPRNVTELTYRYNTEHEANVFVSFQPLVHVENDFEQVMEDFRKDDFECTDLTHNELAKTHIRHLAGGRSSAPHERLFRFHFPEVSAVLVIRCTGIQINISTLFHLLVPGGAATLLGGPQYEVEYFTLSLQKLWR